MVQKDLSGSGVGPSLIADDFAAIAANTTELYAAVARMLGPRYFRQAAPAAKTTSTTLTAAEIIGGLLTSNQGAGGAATYTMPSGTDLQAGLPADFADGDAFEFSIVNISTNAAEVATVQGGSGTTAVGNMTIAPNSATTNQAWGTFRVRKTGDKAFSFYRVG